MNNCIRGYIQIYELKFKKRQLDIVYGVIWVLIGLLWTILIVVCFTVFKAELLVGTVLFTILMALNAVLGFILGNHYITLSSQTYIKVYDKELEINKGLARRNQFIKFEDIEEARLIGNKMYIILKDYISIKEVEIALEVIYMKDLDRLIIDLSENDVPVKRL